MQNLKLFRETNLIGNGLQNPCDVQEGVFTVAAQEVNTLALKVLSFLWNQDAND